jgi:hypothetical protein
MRSITSPPRRRVSLSCCSSLVLGFGGLLATLFSLWRSQAVPRVAVLILLMGFVIDIAGRGTEGHLITFVGATWIAVTILR